jgi:hypothetical protein
MFELSERGSHCIALHWLLDFVKKRGLNFTQHACTSALEKILQKIVCI